MDQKVAGTNWNNPGNVPRVEFDEFSSQLHICHDPLVGEYIDPSQTLVPTLAR